MKFYTYIYLNESNQPYYVGEGSRRRYLDRHRVPVPPLERVVKVYHDTKLSAQDCERELIAKYGRLDIGTGILLNQTDGGAGVANCPRQKAKAGKIGKRTILIAMTAIDPIKRSDRGRKAMEKLNAAHTFETRSAAGKVGIKKMTDAQRAKGGRKNAQSGHLLRLNHRWHLKNGILKDGCSLCQKL